MHYSAGGVLFYEIMQNSDVYISLRQPDVALPDAEREAQVQAVMEGVHVEEGFDCKTQPVVLREGANTRAFVFACPYFALERLGPRRTVYAELRRRAFLRAVADRGSRPRWCGETDERCCVRARRACFPRIWGQ